MNFSTPFIRRPVATFLLALGLLLSGIVASASSPSPPCPSVDIPTIVVFAGRPGADPETMAASIAAPLERRLGEIPGVTEITSTSSIGSTSIVIQFDIGRDIEGAAARRPGRHQRRLRRPARDLPTRPYYRKFNPADAPILTLALTSDTLSAAQVYDAADTILAQRLSPAGRREPGHRQRRREARRPRPPRPRPPYAPPASAARTSTPPSATPTSTAPSAASPGPERAETLSAQRPDHPGRATTPAWSSNPRTAPPSASRDVAERASTASPTPGSPPGRASSPPSCSTSPRPPAPTSSTRSTA